jgi:DnaD/phage-associated family protein
MRQVMVDLKRFKGFTSGETRQLIIPEEFFSELLPEIEDLDELKLTILLLQALNQAEQGMGYFTLNQLSQDPTIMKNFNHEVGRLERALHLALEDGVILKVNIDSIGAVYFVHTAKTKALVEGLGSGVIKYADLKSVGRITQPKNIFKLYEENIGLITPMMAEILKADEEEYSAEWIAEAIKIAVQRNARNWKYVHAILESWKKEGRDGKVGADSQEYRRKFKESWHKAINNK